MLMTFRIVGRRIAAHSWGHKKLWRGTRVFPEKHFEIRQKMVEIPLNPDSALEYESYYTERNDLSF